MSSKIHLFTSNSLQNFKQIKQKTHEVLNFHFFNVMQHCVYDTGAPGTSREIYSEDADGET